MGEYHTIADAGAPHGYRTVCKLGTMDDWRYARRSECEALRAIDAGKGTEIGYMLAQPATLYRFPFFDEDDKLGPAFINDRDMFRSLRLLASPELFEGIEHGTRWVSWGIDGPGKGGAYNVNVEMPCPHTIAKDRKLKTSPLSYFFNVYGERYDGQGRGRTVFTCGYCEAPFSMGADELAKLVELNTPREGDANRQWYLNITSRLKARPNPPSAA